LKLIGHTDPLLRRSLRTAFRLGLDFSVFLTARHSRQTTQPQVFYGGARRGNIGGPLVKIRRLQEYFPESRYNYNLVYVLSNAPYLSERALIRLARQGIPIIHNQNGVFYPGWFSGDWQTENRRMAMSYHRANHVFWQSDFCRSCADRFLGERQGHGTILYNAIDTNHFSPASVDRDDRRRLRFLLTGKLTAHLSYRIDGTLAALAYVRRQGLDAELMIAGWIEPAVRAAAENAAARMKLQDVVLFSGPYTQEDAPEIYRQGDIYIMTKYMDPCPNTVLEAMACGLPVVYSRSGGVPELVGEEAGVGVDVPVDWDRVHSPGTEELGQAMLHAVSHQGRLSENARRRAIAHFDIQDWIGAHRRIFEDLLEGRDG